MRLSEVRTSNFVVKEIELTDLVFFPIRSCVTYLLQWLIERVNYVVKNVGRLDVFLNAQGAAAPKLTSECTKYFGKWVGFSDPSPQP
jgi:hypothetical protein